jgi:fructuronate reductase
VTVTRPPRLARDAPAPPARIAHLGVGAFHRAHQAWYTERAADAGEWGIAGFTGRSPAVADLLAPQGGLYTLVERAADGDRFAVVSSLVRVAGGDRFAGAVAAPGTAVVTMTVTEAGYRLDGRGEPDTADPEVAADLAVLRTLGNGGGQPGAVRTPLARLVLGLERRRRAGGAPLAVVPCDNIPDGGSRVGRAAAALAGEVSPELASWVGADIAFVSCSVDRITPRPEADLGALVRAATGHRDAAPVVTEPFSDWVLHGEFPAGRPAWETAGARFVADLQPWEMRKLWLLNGAHSLLACAGLGRGHTTVADAIADPACRAEVERLWDEAARHLPDGLDVPAYRRALLDRFGNARIRHQLAQIAVDSSTKLRLRIIPVARRERSAGRSAAGCARVIAAWIRLVRAGGDVRDAAGAAVQAAAAAADPVRALVGLLDGGLAADHPFVHSVQTRIEHR